MCVCVCVVGMRGRLKWQTTYLINNIQHIITTTRTESTPLEIEFERHDALLHLARIIARLDVLIVIV